MAAVGRGLVKIQVHDSRIESRQPEFRGDFRFEYHIQSIVTDGLKPHLPPGPGIGEVLAIDEPGPLFPEAGLSVTEKDRIALLADRAELDALAGSHFHLAEHSGRRIEHLPRAATDLAQFRPGWQDHGLTVPLHAKLVLPHQLDVHVREARKDRTGHQQGNYGLVHCVAPSVGGGTGTSRVTAPHRGCPHALECDGLASLWISTDSS